MARQTFQEDAVESPDAVCPCCGEALVVQIDVGSTPNGGLRLNSFAVAHRETPDGTALEQRLDQLPKRKR
jgi:hypothetical protein